MVTENKDDASALKQDKASIIRKVFCDLLENPVIWFRETFVTPNRQEYPWYHRRYRRVPTVDECYEDDPICIFEASQQYFRDRKVDTKILYILKRRYENCAYYHSMDAKEECSSIRKEFDQAETNFFIKYGDMGYNHSAVDAYMKQKHRMLWERRYGPVGSGMPEEPPRRRKKEEKKC